jgi:hypothetical protein
MHSSLAILYQLFGNEQRHCFFIDTYQVLIRSVAQRSASTREEYYNATISRFGKLIWEEDYFPPQRPDTCKFNELFVE